MRAPVLWISPDGYADETLCGGCSALDRRVNARWPDPSNWREDALGTVTTRELPNGHPGRQCERCGKNS